MRPASKTAALLKAFKATGHVVTKHAYAIGMAGYTLGNLYLFAKGWADPNYGIAENLRFLTAAVLHPDLDTAAGLTFIVSSLSLGFTKKFRVAAFRVSGATGILGASLMSAKGIDFGLVDSCQILSSVSDFNIASTLQCLRNDAHGIINNMQIVDGWRAASPLVGFGTTGLLLLFQSEIAAIAKVGTYSKNILMRGFARTQKYPVVLGAAIDAYGITGIAISAAHQAPQTDWQTLGIAAVWTVGAIGMGLSDPRVQERLGHAPKPVLTLDAPKGPR